MSPLQQRRILDLRKVQDLARKSGGRISITCVDGNPIHRIGLSIRATTAGSPAYPRAKVEQIGVEIELPARFPFQAPGARVTTQIFHPNIWSHGQICFGTKWIATEGLDLLVRRIVTIVTFDPLVTNPASPANAAASEWYQAAVRRHPRAFPTDRLAEQLR
ncbi:MAG TPA: ubiquitin-conjugating enzyme E2 [Acetobacteraceae bacterium]|nr:ubiquitin-conjugating enzyme E2 [Acetobacteraceae bacterium]